MKILMQSKLYKVKDFPIEFTSTRVKPSFAIAKEKIEPVVKFENGVMPVFMEILGKVRLPEF